LNLRSIHEKYFLTLAANTTLILIDMQRCMANPARPPRNNLSAEKNIVRLLSAWRSARRPVIHVRHLSLEPDSGFWAGQSGAAFQDAFEPAIGEHVADKHVTDAFAGSGLERYLHLRSITDLVFVGVATNYSVEATVRSAACLAFVNTVVSDACFTFARVDLDGVQRTADEIHLASLSNLTGEYATVRLTNEVLMA
jgi:nicotinamidase-related amidase